MPSAQGSDRRTDILDQAAILFARKGIDGTTVREIADEVGILSGSLYHHFASKDQMVLAILEGYVDTIVARYAAITAKTLDPVERIDALIHASVATAHEFPHATEIYQATAPRLAALGPSDITAKAASIQATWLEAISAGVASGELRDDVDPQVFYRLLRDAMWLSVRWYKPRESTGGVAALGDHCTRIFLDGFARRQTR